jgi:hypothetical protein
MRRRLTRQAGSAVNGARRQAAELTLLGLRGLLLWLVIPLTILAWPMVAIAMRGVRLGALLGWVDLNLVAVLQRTILRPLFNHPASLIPTADLRYCSHRIHMFRDPC